jgi:cytochrome c oxidase assembly protein Cox11
LSDYIYQPFYTEFRQENEVCLVDAGDIEKLNSEAVSRVIHLLKNKRVKFVSMSSKMIEAFSYIDMNIHCFGINEFVLLTVGGKKIPVKFYIDKPFEDYEKDVGEELDICPDIFKFFLENVGVNAWI